MTEDLSTDMWPMFVLRFRSTPLSIIQMKMKVSIVTHELKKKQ